MEHDLGARRRRVRRPTVRARAEKSCSLLEHTKRNCNSHRRRWIRNSGAHIDGPTGHASARTVTRGHPDCVAPRPMISHPRWLSAAPMGRPGGKSDLSDSPAPRAKLVRRSPARLRGVRAATKISRPGRPYTCPARARRSWWAAVRPGRSAAYPPSPGTGSPVHRCPAVA